MENIDYRLDLFNAVSKFDAEMNDANFSALMGNIDLLIFMVSNTESLQNPTEEQLVNFKSMQAFILNSAFEILIKDKEQRDIFMTHFKKTLEFYGK
jgi:hypothetical protein